MAEYHEHNRVKSLIVTAYHEDLQAFAEDARKDAGFQSLPTQAGLSAADWKPMTAFGPGAMDICIRKQGAGRVIYVARFPAAVHVLHAFERKVRRVRQADVDLGFAPEDAAVPATQAMPVTDPRQYIGSKNMTQQKAAAMLGIAPSRVYDLVRGKRETFGPVMLIARGGRLARKVRLAPAA